MKLFLSALFVFVSLHQLAAQETITIGAAANLSSVAESLKTQFIKENPNCRIVWVFGSSGTLTSQIQNGAPYDLFLSADSEFANKIATAGLASGKPQVFALGRMVFFSKKKLDLKKGLKVLLDDNVKTFAMGNPPSVPYGKAAQEALIKAGLWERVKGKAVYGQSVTQVLQFAFAAADGGFINRSAIDTKELDAYKIEGIDWIEIDQSTFSPLEQTVVVLSKSDHVALAEKFEKFLLGPSAREIFEHSGYSSPLQSK